MSRASREASDTKSIFRALFVPLIFIMVLQAGIFYFAAVYGGIEESLNQNAADILSERLINRKNEIEARFNSKWTELDDCVSALNAMYGAYEQLDGSHPLTGSPQRQIQFLADSAEVLIDTLRHNDVNGIFLIINDCEEQSRRAQSGSERKYGLCVRDMDQDSRYIGREDLLLERAPSSLVDDLGCSLDSWWEARYTFDSEHEGDFYYSPLNAAWENPGTRGADLAYCSGIYRLSGSDQAMVAYSVPLIGPDGYPYGVLGVELTARYLALLLPNKELNDADKCCYVLAMREKGMTQCVPIIGSGALYNRCFGSDSVISCADSTSTGGFTLLGREGTELYGSAAALNVYNDNNMFGDKQLVLLAMVESSTLFSYIGRIKLTLLLVSLATLALGMVGLALISRRFAAPITALAGRVRGIKASSDFRLGRLGITEIDQLVESIEELNRNVSRNSARTEFFSRMSHDMRTPMNAIISFSSPKLLEGAAETEKNDYLKKINASGRYLLELINEVLDVTRIESSAIKLRMEPLPANRLFEPITTMVSELARSKGVEFRAEISAGQDACVMGDEQHLNQIVMNLLSNAVKFTPLGGTVDLRVNVSSGEDERHMLCRVVVSDTGIGMSEEFMSRLYIPFEQENSGEGTGLGLSIAKKLVELMGGTIECVSRRNMGTSFTVLIPMERGVLPAGEEAAPAATGGQETLRGKRVLVCEDNPVNMQIIQRLLENAGMVVTCAENGKEGVDAFAGAREGGFDAVLMDIRMPVMDGLAAAAAIRALPRADAASVPILAMTANAFAEDVQASMAAGMNAHLTKPVEPELMYAALVQHIR